jgi:hypothetical protein
MSDQLSRAAEMTSATNTSTSTTTNTTEEGRRK